MRRVLDPDAFVISSALTLYLVCWASALWFSVHTGRCGSPLRFGSDSSDMVGTGLMARSGVAEFPAMRRKDRLRMDDRLITPERREWLLDQLGELIGRCGSDRFVAGPLLEPMPALLPRPLGAESARPSRSHAASDDLRGSGTPRGGDRGVWGSYTGTDRARPRGAWYHNVIRGGGMVSRDRGGDVPLWRRGPDAGRPDEARRGPGTRGRSCLSGSARPGPAGASTRGRADRSHDHLPRLWSIYRECVVYLPRFRRADRDHGQDRVFPFHVGLSFSPGDELPAGRADQCPESPIRTRAAHPGEAR